MAALLAYDILLNLGREKELIWDTKFRTSSVLYYMTRYPVVAYQVFNVCYSPTTTPKVRFAFIMDYLSTFGDLILIWALVVLLVVRLIKLGFLATMGETEILMLFLLAATQSTKQHGPSRSSSRGYPSQVNPPSPSPSTIT